MFILHVCGNEFIESSHWGNNGEGIGLSLNLTAVERIDRLRRSRASPNVLAIRSNLFWLLDLDSYFSDAHGVQRHVP